MAKSLLSAQEIVRILMQTVSLSKEDRKMVLDTLEPSFEALRQQTIRDEELLYECMAIGELCHDYLRGCLPH